MTDHQPGVFESSFDEGWFAFEVGSPGRLIVWDAADAYLASADAEAFSAAEGRPRQRCRFLQDEGR
jgi:hypothetical protein